MTDANSLPYYPRFIFNCNDGRCLSTGDLSLFQHIKDAGSKYEISRFVPGQTLSITWLNDDDKKETKNYTVREIEIHQIKYDLDEPTYGLNSNDCTAILGRDKKWMMEIYVFLDLKK